MVSFSTNYANPFTVGRFESEHLVDDGIRSSLVELIDAHHDLDEAEVLNNEGIQALDLAIATLKEQREALVVGKASAVSIAHQKRDKYSGKIVEALTDDSSDIHPIYRAVLLASICANEGTFWYPKTLAIADEIGRQMYGLNGFLLSSEESSPIIDLRYRHSPSEDEHNALVSITYGNTSPGTGMTPHVYNRLNDSCICGIAHDNKQPKLILPVNNNGLGFAAANNLSLLARDVEVMFRRNGERYTMPVESDQRHAPDIPAIPLPTGNFFELDDTLALYKSRGTLVEVNGASRLGRYEETICAIGALPIRQVLLEMFGQISQTVQSMYPYLELFKVVAGAVGVEIADREFVHRG